MDLGLQKTAAEHDPLHDPVQFGGLQDEPLDSQEDLPPAYGTSSHEALQQHTAADSGSPASTVSNSGTPSAAAVGAAAAAMAMAAAANSGGAVSPPPVGNPELRIAVHNPLRHMGPSGLVPGLEEAYISYEVTTVTSLPHFSSSRCSVRRRFRDFVSLSNLLPKLLHGSFLPARPDKNMIEGRRMTEAFVEERRASLERYLNRLAAHPAAARSEALRVFLEADGNLRSSPSWRCLKPAVLTPIQATNRLLRTLVGARKTAPTPSEVVQPAAACRDVYRLLHENMQQLRGSFKHSPLGAEEVSLRDDTALVEDEAAALHVALHRAEAWNRAAQRRAALLGESAAALEALASYEGSYAGGQPGTTAALGAAAKAMQLCGDASSHASSNSASVLQPLRDHHAITPNVMAALHGRERQLLTVMTLRQDLEDKRARLSAAQLMPASQAKKVDALRSVVGQLEVSAAAAEAEYNRQLARNKDELAGLRQSRGQELTGMLAALVTLELKHEQQQAAVWQQLLQSLPQPGLTTAYMAQRELQLGAQQ
ncbi:hypothetical protein OEZ85_010254 [Tetradesmus obliquus]|uniref:PX domain-containing protein n=1 Tax=Tetradesmus obliquus TaxID=3088 RepID=A0ABY8TLR4_TETOB|nr:hypothetical protein OEZ85_010254 [Tetradesmus obliquus]